MNKREFQQKYGPWAIVTGASAGIGAEFARQLGARGLNVVLVARRAEKLAELAADIEQAHRVKTRIVSLDLTMSNFIQTLRQSTSDLEVGLLVNNAGAAELGPFLQNSIEVETRNVDLNVRAPMILAHTYGQDFVARGQGGILMLSSGVGLAGVSNYTNYAATKAYDLILGEGLAQELRPLGVDVMVVAPGFTDSEYMAGMDLSGMPLPMPIMKTETLVQMSLASLGSRLTLLIPGGMNKMMYWTMKLLGRKGSTRMMSYMIGMLGRQEATPNPSLASHSP